MREDLFIKFSPKFLLDHYWSILSCIFWRCLVKDSFTLSSLKEELLKEASELHDKNPIVFRVYARSLDLIEDVVNELLNLGLLIRKENDIFRGTEDFMHFYCLLKDNIRRKLKRFIGWAVFYIYHSKDLRSFSIRELVNLISHSDEEYVKEIPYLMKYEDKKWLKVLERHGDKWRIVQKPYRSTKPILLTYINDRLQAAILELSKEVDEFTEHQVVDKLRNLECNCAERILTKIGLKKKDEIWHIDESTIKEIEESIFEPIRMEANWPLFGIRSTVNPYFKIEGIAHYAYVDMPHLLIDKFLDKLYDLSETYEDNLERLYIEANKLKKEFNEFFKQNFGGWLSAIIKREFFSSKPFGIQIKIDWSSFQKFLKDLAGSENISLEKKYEYLSMCRFDLAWMFREPSEELMKKRVKLMARSSIEKINDILTTFTKDLLKRKGKYRRKLLLEKGFYSLTLSYLPEVILTFRVIGNCINEGAISTCYREMRKILESLSWVMIDDILLFRKGEITCEKIDFPPLRTPSKRWYDWARSNGLIIRGLNEWEKPLGILIQKISEKYNLCKSEVEVALFDNITYPLFLVSARTEKAPPDELKDFLIYNVEEIKPLVKENIKRILSHIVKRPLYEDDEKFIEYITDTLLMKNERFSIRYPSNSFIIQLFEKISKLRLSSLYDRYSYFVHSYDKTWQFHPFSSVVEFEIFKHELDYFIKLLRRMFDFYEKEVLLKRER